MVKGERKGHRRAGSNADSILISISLTHSTSGVTQEPPQGSFIWLFGAPGIPVSTENSESMQKSSDLSCPAVVSRACSHSSRASFMARWSVSRPRGIGARAHCAPPPAGNPASPASWSPPALRARSSTLDLALPGLAAVLERHGIGEAGDRSPLAPSRLPALLALALKVWTAVSRSRSS